MLPFPGAQMPSSFQKKLKCPLLQEAFSDSSYQLCFLSPLCAHSLSASPPPPTHPRPLNTVHSACLAWGFGSFYAFHSKPSLTPLWFSCIRKVWNVTVEWMNEWRFPSITVTCTQQPPSSLTSPCWSTWRNRMKKWVWTLESNRLASNAMSRLCNPGQMSSPLRAFVSSSLANNAALKG